MSQAYDDSQVEVLVSEMTQLREQFQLLRAQHAEIHRSCNMALAQRDEALAKLAEVPSQVEEFVRDAEKFVELIERAEKLLRSAGAIMEEFHVYHQGFREDADAWLRDAGFEK